MKNSILFVVFLILTFILNIWFYYISSDYRDFLKSIKNEEEVIEKNEQESNTWKIIDPEITQVEVNNKDNEIFKDKINVELKNEIVLWKSYENILNIFDTFWLSKLELNTNLFDLTDEYPDNYIEYYSKWLTLYLFPTRSYREVYDVFDVLELELPFKVNEVNNFWNKSFYINLDKDIDDWFIRLVIENNWVTFWLKINKNEYNLVKEKLKNLKNN